MGSRDNSKTAGAPSQALVGTHVSAMRCDTTALETGKKMDSTERTGTESEREHRRTIDIAVLNESELLTMIKGYVNSMNDFAKRTRNVHKELKDTLANTGLVLNQYLKIKSSTSTGEKANDSSTQTEDIPIDNVQSETIQSKKTSSREAARRECKDAATNTASPQAVPEKQRKQQQQQQKQQQQQQQQRRKGKTTQPSEANSQPEKTQPEPEAAFTLVTNPKKNTNGSRPQSTRKTTQRPAAVLIKVGEGRTYADTLRQVRGTPIDFEGLGTHVTSMRKTMKGDLLVELTKGTKAIAATSKIRDRLAEAITGSVVTRLRHSAEVEITDLDEVATKEEVLAAIRKAMINDDPLSEEEIKVTGLWATREGRQMATATVPIKFSRSLTSVRVGWTQCRVRPRRPEPARCYRCHGFGHSTRQCTGPDLTAACRRCGAHGHMQSSCTEGDDKCVACDRLKATRVPHKPGSGACAARRNAISEMNATRQK